MLALSIISTVLLGLLLLMTVFVLFFGEDNDLAASLTYVFMMIAEILPIVTIWMLYLKV